MDLTEKRMKSIKKKIRASALAVTLLGGAFMPKAKAEGDTDVEIWKDLKITKILNKVEKGVTTPDTEFEFSFTPKTVDALYCVAFLFYKIGCKIKCDTREK